MPPGADQPAESARRNRVAFQIVYNVLHLIGDGRRLGTPPGSDLR